MLPTLQLVSERKICDLMPRGLTTKRWEASGVLVKDGQFFVVFDDRAEIARIAADLKAEHKNELFGNTRARCGYEGITYNPTKRRYYLLVEACKHSKSCYKASIVEYDEEFQYVKDRPVDFTFESGNKGFEAVAHLRRNEK